MGQLRILKGGWGVFGQPPFKENDVIEDEVLPKDLRDDAIKGGKAERVAVTTPATPKAGGNS
jgi:hypothetical protein